MATDTELKTREPANLSTHELIHVLWDRMAQNHQQYEGRDERLWIELEDRLKALHRFEDRTGPPMTPAQEKHLLSIKTRFCTMVDRKYREGQKEHGGDLFAKSAPELCHDSVMESIDQVVYTMTLADKLL